MYRIERDLEKRELKHARETFYDFRTNTPDDQLCFIKQNFLPSAKKRRYIKAIKKDPFELFNSNLDPKSETKPEDHDSEADLHGMPF